MQEMKNDSAVLERHMNELEKEYEAANADPENTERLEELRFQVSGLIGKNNLNILREYTDRLIAQYNTEPDWFYKKGLEDACKLPFPPNKVHNFILGR